jgi:probable addiction module antidote protein
MAKKIKVSDLPDFDMAECLKDEADVAAYLSLVIEEGDPSELAHALGVASRAKGMSEIARDSGISREALYRALRHGAHPRFDTIARVCAALGIKLTAIPAKAA